MTATPSPPSRAALSPAPRPAGLVTASAPPLRLPVEHFVAGFVCLALGGAGLVWIAPSLAAGAFVSTQVVAVVHLFTLGFISMSILGALYQFLPVAVNTPIRSQRLAHLTFALFLLGIVVFLAGLLAAPPLLPLGGGLTALALTLFAGNFIATLARAKERSVTWWALAAAAFFLVVTLGLGFTLALNLRTGLLLGGRFETLLIHVHVALGGWALLVMVGVGHRLLPMFMLSHGATQLPSRIAVAGLAAGTVLLALPLGTPVRLAGFVLAAAGVVAFLVQAAAFYRHRKRRSLDPGMRLALAGLGGVGAALGLAPFAWFHGWQSVRLLSAYVFLLVAGISLFIAGHYFKIVPFVVWYHRWGTRVGRERVPSVADLYSASGATRALAALVAGVLGIAAGILAGHAGLLRAGAFVFLLGIGCEGREMIRIARKKA